MRPRLWWIGVLFMVGSTAFALGSAPFYAKLVDPALVGITFFVGSIFFTTASLLQLRQTPRFDRLDWWACVVQFAGTLFFNVTTFTAMGMELAYAGNPAAATIEEGDQLIQRLAEMVVGEIREALGLPT